MDPMELGTPFPDKFKVSAEATTTLVVAAVTLQLSVGPPLLLQIKQELTAS